MIIKTTNAPFITIVSFNIPFTNNGHPNNWES